MKSKEIRFVILLFVLLVIAPIFNVPGYLLYTFTIAFVFAMLATSWDFLFGYTGQLSFGHAAFFAVGAYSSVLLSMNLNVSPWVTILFGGGVSMIVGAGIGYVCLRLAGPYLALTTLAFCEVLSVLVVSQVKITRGALGLSGYLTFEGITSNTGYYYLGLFFMVVTTVGFLAIASSNLGLKMKALRDDPIKAENVGINTTAYKIIGFMLSSLVAGFAGGFYAHFVQVLTPEVFGFRWNALPIGMSVLGGRGTIIGAVLGAILIHVGGDTLSRFGPVYELLLIGALIVIIMAYCPGGFWSLVKKILYPQKGITVPSTESAISKEG